MNELPQHRPGIPVLTEVFDTRESAPPDPQVPSPLEAARRELLEGVLQLIDQAVRRALADLGAPLAEQVSAQVRAGLPALVEQALGTHPARGDDSTER